MVSTPSANMSQNGNLLYKLGVKRKNIWNQHPVLHYNWFIANFGYVGTLVRFSINIWPIVTNISSTKWSVIGQIWSRKKKGRSLNRHYNWSRSFVRSEQRWVICRYVLGPAKGICRYVTMNVGTPGEKPSGNCEGVKTDSQLHKNPKTHPPKTNECPFKKGLFS